MAKYALKMLEIYKNMYNKMFLFLIRYLETHSSNFI